MGGFAQSKEKYMCQTEIISQAINRIGYRSFERRMNQASPFFAEKRGEMTRLLNEVDSLCEQLHEDFPTISPDDYRVFGPKLRIVIATLKALLRESRSQSGFASYQERLKGQIADLEELEQDIKTFRVEASQNDSQKTAMSTIGKLDFSRLVKTK